MERGVAAGVHIRKPRTRLGKRLAPYLLVLPGGLWLLIFFLIPIVFMASVSLQTGNLEEGFRQTWHFHRYIEVFQQYRPQFVRSFVYGSIAKGQDTASSDIDVMVIAESLTYPDLFAVLEEASAQLGRKVAPTIYSSKELSKRAKQDNAFVTRVLAQPKLWLIGDESALAT